MLYAHSILRQIPSFTVQISNIAVVPEHNIFGWHIHRKMHNTWHLRRHLHITVAGQRCSYSNSQQLIVHCAVGLRGSGNPLSPLHIRLYWTIIIIHIISLSIYLSTCVIEAACFSGTLWVTPHHHCDVIGKGLPCQKYILSLETTASSHFPRVQSQFSHLSP